MTKGVVFYNRGTKCLARLLVSLHSLRKHYQGPVTILTEETFSGWIMAECMDMGAEIKVIPKRGDYVLVAKASCWRDMPYDASLYLDADIIVQAPVQPLLELIAEKGCVVTQFNNWRTDGRKIGGRIEAWRCVDAKAVDAAKKPGPAINTGIMGWRRGDNLLNGYEAMTSRGMAAGRKVGKKTLDEIAMQLAITDFPANVVGGEWNTGCVHGDHTKAKIIHYHGNKHCRNSPASEPWKATYRELVAGRPELDRELRATGDKSLVAWLSQESGEKSGMTIVTAVNPIYADRCRENLARWLATPGLKDHHFLVFVNGFKNASERAFLDHPQVKVVRWNYQFPEASTRETMLAAFVLGVAEHVTTPYWMKLDCDTRPKQGKFVWPVYTGHTITSHKWGYTKLKGYDGGPHWFNKLDCVMAPVGQQMFFTLLSPSKDFKVSHRPGNPHGIKMRFASFAHIEKTAFTKRVAREVMQRSAGRLPIPSHDTLAWYCATLWKEPVQLVNMKEWFQP